MSPHPMKMVLAAAMSFIGLSAASAQDAPPPAESAPRCGGLFCDLGIVGSRAPQGTQLPCSDFLCRAFGGSRAAEVAPPPPAAPEPAPVEPVKSAHKTSKHKAKVAARTPAPKADATAPAVEPAAK